MNEAAATAGEASASPADAARPEPVAALSAAIDRGHHLALLAGEGGGLAALYAAAALHDLADAGPEARAFILTATSDRARRCARAMVRLVGEARHEIRAVAEGAPPPAEGGGRIVLGTPAHLLEEIRAGRMSAAELRTLALDDVRALGPAWPAVEGILQACGPDARRIAVTHRRDEAFDDLLVRQLPRARKWPPELFEGAPPAGGPELRVALSASRQGRLARLVDLLHELAAEGVVEGVLVGTASADAVPDVEAALVVEGFQLADADAEDGVRVRPLEAGPASRSDAAIAFELPAGAAGLRLLAEARSRYAIVAPLHAPQLELLAARLGWKIVAIGGRLEGELRDEVAAFREEVEDALREEDLAAGTLLLDPLLEEHGSARVAAALAGLLRAARRGPADADRAEPSAERAASPTWTKVFVNVGKRDGARPGDLVGAITGEAGVAGAQIGRVDIRQSFTLVDVDSLVADRVVRGLDGSRIKSRQVTARLDREGR